MNCARMGCGHPETLHAPDGKCWCCACERLIFAPDKRIDPSPPTPLDPDADDDQGMP